MLKSIAMAGFLALTSTMAMAADVMVGGETDFDACGAYGKVTGLNPNGDNFLAVRSRPSTSGAEMDRLGPGAGVFMCDDRNGWIGVVYPPKSDPNLSCGVGSPIANRQPYQGPCNSGWVFGKYITLIAG